MGDHRTLEVWRMANALAKDVHRLRARLPLRERTIGEQVWSAALSVPCNIVEGYARSSPQQLKYHLNVAIASLAEARYLAGLIAELGLASDADVAPSLVTMDALLPKLAAFVRAVEAGRARHSRFRRHGRGES